MPNPEILRSQLHDQRASPSPGYALDINAYDVTVSSGETAKTEVKEIPQNNPLSLVLQKLDADLKDAIPQALPA